MYKKSCSFGFYCGRQNIPLRGHIEALIIGQILGCLGNSWVLVSMIDIVNSVSTTWSLRSYSGY